jgi:nucleoside-diphosphate-sugar epimerase
MVQHSDTCINLISTDTPPAGPPIHEVDREKGVNGLNTSVKRLATSVMGKDPAFAPKVGTPVLPAWVDVRDIADAHAKALQLPQGTSERFLLCGGVDYFEDGIQGLRTRGEKGLGEVGARCDTSKHFAIDSSKAEKLLEISFIPFERTIEDTWESLKSLGFVE